MAAPRDFSSFLDGNADVSSIVNPTTTARDFTDFLDGDKPIDDLVKPAGPVEPAMPGFAVGRGAAYSTVENMPLAADAMEGLGQLIGNDKMIALAQRASKAGKDLTHDAGLDPTIGSFKNIPGKTAGDTASRALTYAGESAGQAAGSTLPTVAGGVAGFAVGGPIGAAAGAFAPSYVQNYGDMYSSIKDDAGVKAKVASGDLSNRDLAAISAVAAIPISALDMLSATQIAKPILKPLQALLKRNIIEGVAKQVAEAGAEATAKTSIKAAIAATAKEAVRDALWEGTTEGLQQVIEEATQSVTGDTPFFTDERMTSIADNAFAGFFGGALMGGASHAIGKAMEPGTERQIYDEIDRANFTPEGNLAAAVARLSPDRAQMSETPVLTPDEQDSPIGHLAAEGRQEIAAAMRDEDHNTILDTHNLPPLGSRVSVNYGDGRIESGEIGGTFQAHSAELGQSVPGVTVHLDSGQKVEELIETLTRAGVTITPEIQQQAVAAQQAADGQGVQAGGDVLPVAPGQAAPAAPVQTEPAGAATPATMPAGEPDVAPVPGASTVTEGQQASGADSARYQPLDVAPARIEGKDPRTITYKLRGDGVLERTIRYDDGTQNVSFLLAEDKTGDEQWVSGERWSSGKKNYNPLQLHKSEAEKWATDDLASMGPGGAAVPGVMGVSSAQGVNAPTEGTAAAIQNEAPSERIQEPAPILRQDGQPFPTIEAARGLAKTKAFRATHGKGYIATAVDGGFGLKLRKTVANAQKRGPVHAAGGHDMLTVIASHGGISDQAGDDVKKLQKLIPHYGPLVRKGGMNYDDLALFLHQQGFYGPTERQGPDGNMEATPRPDPETVKRDIALARKAKRYLPEHQAEIEAEHRIEQDRAEEVDARAEIKAEAEKQSLGFSEADIESILQIMGERGVDAAEAIDLHADHVTVDDLTEGAKATEDASYHDIPFDLTDEAQPTEGGGNARSTEPGQTRTSAAAAEGKAPRGSPAEAGSTEKVETVDGPRDQAVIPGAEKDAEGAAKAAQSTAEQKARLKGAQSKLRAGKPQEEAGGMFAPEQKDLLSAPAEKKTDTGIEFSRIDKDTEQVGVTADIKRLIDLFGPKMYSRDMTEVTMKELLQNAFDGLKSGYASDKIPRGTGKVNIYTDLTTRTLGMTDNGIGMSPQTVKDAFLTIAGTEKGGLSTAERSGGFGVAKMAFIFGNEGLYLETVKDGVRTTLDTSGAQLLDGKAQLHTEATTDPNGTIIKVKVPAKYVTDKGGEDDVRFPTYPTAYDILNKPLIGDIEVRFHADKTVPDKPGFWKKLFDKINPLDQVPFSPDTEGQLLKIGRHQDLSKTPLLTTAHFHWGDIQVYFSAKKVGYGYTRVLSSGLYQFDSAIPQPGSPYSAIPYDVILNVRPNVDADSGAYPFTKQREAWNKRISRDIGALTTYLQKVYLARELYQQGGGFAAVQTMPVTRDEVTSGAVPFTDAGLEKHLPIKDAPPVTLAPDVYIDDGVMRADGKTIAIDGEKLKGDPENSFAAYTIPSQNLDDKVPYFHSNLNVDIVKETALKHGFDEDDLRDTLARVGTVVLDFREQLGKIPGYEKFSRADRKAEPRLVGISLDKSYHGVSIKVPYYGFFLNPLSVKEKTIGGQAAAMVHTMMHEAVHENVSGHSESFTIELGRLYGQWADNADVSAGRFEDRLREILTEGKAGYDAMREVYNDAATKNVAEPSESDRSADKPGSAPRGTDFSRRSDDAGRQTERSGAGASDAQSTGRGSFAGSAAERVDFTPGGGSKEVKLGNTTIDYGVATDGKTAEVILVKTPKAARRNGSARAAMTEFIAQADAKGLTLFLTPDPVGDGASKFALRKFYRSLGFRDNSGPTRDFTSRASMVREVPAPVKESRAATPSYNEAMTQSAVDYFGVTDDPREAGYVLPDGRMLDLSGRNMGAGEDNAGKRVIDHRDLPGSDEGGPGAGSATERMQEFMRETGAARVDFKFGVFQAIAPSRQQLESAVFGAEAMDQPLTVALMNKDGGEQKSAKIRNPTVAKLGAFYKSGGQGHSEKFSREGNGQEDQMRLAMADQYAEQMRDVAKKYADAADALEAEVAKAKSGQRIVSLDATEQDSAISDAAAAAVKYRNRAASENAKADALEAFHKTDAAREWTREMLALADRARPFDLGLADSLTDGAYRPPLGGTKIEHQVRMFDAAERSYRARRGELPPIAYVRDWTWEGLFDGTKAATLEKAGYRERIEEALDNIGQQVAQQGLTRREINSSTDTATTRKLTGLFSSVTAYGHRLATELERQESGHKKFSAASLAARTAEFEQALIEAAPAKLSRPGEHRTAEPAVEPTEITDEQFAAMQKTIAARIKEVGLTDKVAAAVDRWMNDPNVQGSYRTRVISLAGRLADESRAWVLNHELIHAFRDMGLITDMEWLRLRREALADTARMDEIRKRYPDLSEDEQIEEAIADTFADWKAAKVDPGKLRALLDRIIAFVTAIRRAMTDAGYKTSADLFEGIDRGHVAAWRTEGAIDEPGPMGISPKFMAEAWHGTPHDFDEFDLAKIGSGEGAQAYGWGLYFAGNKEVADHYRRKLSGADVYREVLVNGASESAIYNGAYPLQGQMTEAQLRNALGHIVYYARLFKDPAVGIEEARKVAQGDYPAGSSQADAKILFDAARVTVRPDVRHGKLLQVDLAPAESDYLLWDKPIYQQSPMVRDAIERLANEHFEGAAIDKARATGLTSTGEDFYRGLSQALGGPWATSRALLEAGIRGNKYLDGASRNRPLREIKKAFLDALPEDAEFDDVKEMVGNGTFSAEQETFLRELEKNDWLGFDYPAQAISAALSEGVHKWDPTPELTAAVDALKDGGNYNYVIFDAADVKVQQKFSRPRPPGAVTPAVTFDNAETEARFQDARTGVAGPADWIGKLSDRAKQIRNGFSRHWIHLPNEARFYDVGQQLRKLEAAPQASKETIVRILQDLTHGMNAADLELFTRKVILDDLAWETQQDHALPFGFTPATVRSELAKIDTVLNDRPDLVDKIRTRKVIASQVAQQLVENDILSADQIKNPAYYRHVVLEYARAEVAAARGAGKQVRTPYWAKRMGSTLDINANLLEAEFDWLHKAFMDISTAKTLSWIKDSNLNVRDQVIAAAREHNNAQVQTRLDADMRENGFMRGVTQTSPMNEEWIDFKRRIAIGLGKISKAADDGRITNVPAVYSNVLTSLEHDNTADDGQLFNFLSWMIDNQKPGWEGAAMVFKSIQARKAWTQSLLGRRFADARDMNGLIKLGLAPEGHVAWQPNSPGANGKALVLFTAKTVSEHTVDRVVNALTSDIALTAAQSQEVAAAFQAQVRDALTVGGPQYQMILPQELADTLSNFRDKHAEKLFEALFSEPLGYWKRWTLISPRRVLKYNINNLSGDLDAVIAGNPSALKRFPAAFKELSAVMLKGEAPSQNYRDAVERGVFDSGLSIQEIPDINVMGQFSHLFDKRGITEAPFSATAAGILKVWRGLEKATQFRENWLRYSAYLDYAERLRAGETMDSIGYGASFPQMVDAITDTKDRAALLARDLVGDYGNVSAYGQEIRRKVLPFYSWMEVNTKRYWRLLGNAYGDGIGRGLATSGYLGATMGVRRTLWLGARIAMISAMVVLWNNLLFGDEEDKLADIDRAQLHINLGTWGGEAKTLRFQGAFSDFLGWIGFPDVVATMSAVAQGRAGYGEMLETIAKAPIKKIAASLTPLITVPLELIGGQKYFPDMFHPTTIRDRWRDFAATFNLENEYDLATGKPSRGYLKSLEGAALYSKDPGEIAYNKIRGLAYDWLQRNKGVEGASASVTPRSTALYEWKLAQRYGDKEAEHRAFEKMRSLGMDANARMASIRSAAPLAPLNIMDRSKFKRTLTPRERESLDAATAWYHETFHPGAGRDE